MPPHRRPRCAERELERHFRQRAHGRPVDRCAWIAIDFIERRHPLRVERLGIATVQRAIAIPVAEEIEKARHRQDGVHFKQMHARHCDTFTMRGPDRPLMHTGSSGPRVLPGYGRNVSPSTTPSRRGSVPPCNAGDWPTVTRITVLTPLACADVDTLCPSASSPVISGSFAPLFVVLTFGCSPPIVVVGLLLAPKSTVSRRLLRVGPSRARRRAS